MQRFSVLEQLVSFTVNRDTEIMSCMSANQHTIAKLQSETAAQQPKHKQTLMFTV